jgi:hypothetical protein
MRNATSVELRVTRRGRRQFSIIPERSSGHSRLAARILELYENASQKADQRITGGGSDWILVDHGVDRRNRAGGIAQVIGYCMRGDPLRYSMTLGSFGMPEPMLTAASPETRSESGLPSYYTSLVAMHTGLCGPHTYQTGLLLPLFSLLRCNGARPVPVSLAFISGPPWFTSSYSRSAVMIHMQTPPNRIGCRSLTYILYGANGTITFLFMVLSSVLAHRSRLLEGHNRTTITQHIQGTLAISLRWAGKTLGVLNGVGIVVASIMQSSGIYDNCFCSFTVFGSDKGVIHLTDPSHNEVVKFWIGVRDLSLFRMLNELLSGCHHFGCCSLYTAAIYVGSPMNRE